MADAGWQHLNFDHGIESIVHHRGDPDTPQLPQRRDVSPAADAAQTKLAALLDRPTLDGLLDQWVDPGIADDTLTRPAPFRQRLEDTAVWLDDCAQRDPDNAKIINRALRVISDERNLRDLLGANRAALFQG